MANQFNDKRIQCSYTEAKDMSLFQDSSSSSVLFVLLSYETGPGNMFFLPADSTKEQDVPVNPNCVPAPSKDANMSQYSRTCPSVIIGNLLIIIIIIKQDPDRVPDSFSCMRCDSV